ncbi:MAG: helical backbone metal receptor [Ferruginibacter sp.]
MILSSPSALNYIPKKIISLVPSQTELLHYLGLEDETIAITKFCVHPENWFRTKTRIGGTKTLNIEKIIELDPDLIIANNEENVKEQVEMLAEKFPVWVTDVVDLATSIKMIGDIGQLVGKEDDANNLELRIMNVFKALEDEIKARKTAPIRSAYFIWKNPYMTIGGDTFINDMMKRCGLKNIFEDEKRYPEVNIEQLKKMNCELVLLSSEPFPFAEKHITELQVELPGVKILLADGEIFSWYGSRLLEAGSYFRKFVQDLRFKI